jgi:hypothetical protein
MSDIKAAYVGGRALSSFLPSPMPGVVSTSTCLNRGCQAVVGITSLMGVIGNAAFTTCQGDGPAANQFDVPATESTGTDFVSAQEAPQEGLGSGRRVRDPSRWHGNTVLMMGMRTACLSCCRRA